MSNGNEAKSIEKKGTAAQLQDLLAKQSKAIASLVPEHLTPERLMRVAVNCVSKTPGLQQCTPSSLLNCVLAAAEVGLEPGGVLGQFYLVPFGQVCTPIIGYRGLLELARRTGQIASIRAVVVHQKDVFEVSEGIEQTIVHKPSLAEAPGPLVFVYAVAKLKDGSIQVEVMSKAQVDAVRARSRAGNNGPWVTDYDEMAKKTVFRRLAKWLPLASERFEKALELDNSEYIEGEVVHAHEQVASELANVKERVSGKVRRLPSAGPETPAMDLPAEPASEAQAEPPPAS